METLLGGLAFLAFLLAQVAAVISIHAGRTRHGFDAFEKTRLDPRARVISEAGG